jgi:hypothetical protein
MLNGCNSGFTDPSREFGPEVPEHGMKHAVRIHQPQGLGVADVDMLDARRVPLGVKCATCHAKAADKPWVDRTDAPKDFHENVKVTHGELSCKMCHGGEDKSKLHLADGRPIDVEDAIVLCGQCHGVQYRDYKNGSHGGMSGYWDLRRGGRERNHCIDCHAPHAPAYQKVMPVHPPRDRYLEVHHESHQGGH